MIGLATPIRPFMLKVSVVQSPRVAEVRDPAAGIAPTEVVP